MLRFAVTSHSVDNWFAGGLCVPVNLEKEVLGRYGVLKDGLTFHEIHPGSGIGFADQPVPFFGKAVALVKKLQAGLRIKSAGWDIALLEQGPVVMEANQRWDIFFAAQLSADFVEKFLAFHLPEQDMALRLEFSGEFPDRSEARRFVCDVAGIALASGRLEQLSRETLVFTIAGARAALNGIQDHVGKAGFRGGLAGMRTHRSGEQLRPGLDIDASFSAAADEIYGPEKPFA